ncbi:hypothetical protein KEJ18_07555, partial [Candidatus Bathyarchaeota archaeon]|nr:hypothetical protein [Candidatus Bathyarchaeota archaeon]
RYLPFIAVQRLMQVEKISAKELFDGLGISGKAGKRVLKRLLEMHESSGKGLFAEDFNVDDEDVVLRLNENATNYWLRIKEIALSTVEKVFNSSEHPLMLGEGESWLTVLDMNAINLMLIQMLREQALNRRVLVVGIAKDTSASDYIRAVIPYAKREGVIPKEEKLPNLRHDRAFLTILSSMNPDLFSVPWRTLSYDSCFTTLVEGDTEVPLRAARQVVAI